MQRLKFSLIISVFFLLASTTAFLLHAQEPRDWTNLSGTVVLKSGVLDVNRTSQELENGTPTKVYVRVDSGLKYFQYDKLGAADRSYVRQELGLPEDFEGDSSEKSIEIISVEDGLNLPQREKYAFLVAASHYDSGVEPLLYTGNDVEDIKARLLELGFSEENIVVLRSGIDFEDVPTKKHIEERYKQLLSCVQSGDLVLVYLSGHGLQLNRSDVSYFAPVDVDLSDLENSSVSINAMMKQLADSEAEFRWMIVDACRNDPHRRKSVFTTKALGVKGMTDVENIPNSISLLQSCQPGACSFEGGGNKYPDVHNGVFTLALLEALGEDGKGDVNKDGAVSFLEICQYVSKRTNVLANLYHHEEQIPKLRGDFTDFAFLEVGKSEAAQAYQEGLELFDQADYFGAFEKFSLACQKDPGNQEYARMLGVVKKIVDDAGKAEEARLAAEKAEAERKAAEERAARLAAEKAEAERKRKESEEQASSWSGTFKAGTRRTITYKGVEFAFCYCPAGSFMMGSPESEEGRGYNETQHKVTLTKGFWMQETELTQEQWDVLGVKNECYFKGKDLPVDTVNWHECIAYIAKLNELGIAPAGMKFSLPTEAQWEYACRAGTTTAYSWGDSLNDDKANYNGNDPYGTTKKGKYLKKTTPVKSYAPNPWGLYDMHGNIMEWCSDQDGKYPDGAVVDPADATDTNASDRALRGGGWDFYASMCRSASRCHFPADWRKYFGFRLLLLE